MSKVIGKTFKVLGIIWDVLLILMILGVLLVRVAPLPFGYQPVVVMSNSMAPTFHTGSMCYIDTNYDKDNIEVGDIIAFKLNDGTQVTHRVHEITEDGIVTKGDANKDVDISPISKDQIIGENVKQIEYLGILFSEFPNKILIFTVIFVLAVKAILWFIPKLLLEEGEDEDVEKNKHSNRDNTSSNS